MPSAITLNNEPILVEGELLKVGATLPFFTLVNSELEDITLDSFAGKAKVINIFPSVDTPTCAQSVRAFNKAASNLANTVVINVSADLPFAQARFCAAEGLNNVVNLSCLRGRDMFKNYGVLLVTSKLAGLAARAVIVADAQNVIKHVELVPVLSDEPNYQAALDALK